jgi:hypothetical protein
MVIGPNEFVALVVFFVFLCAFWPLETFVIYSLASNFLVLQFLLARYTPRHINAIHTDDTTPTPGLSPGSVL